MGHTDISLSGHISHNGRYLGVEKVTAQTALTRSLTTQSPAFYGDISPGITRESLRYASG